MTDTRESERAVLACAFLDPECAKRLAAELTTEHFQERYRPVMAAIKKLVEEGTPVEFVTVNQLTGIPLDKLCSLTQEHPTPATFDYYLAPLHEAKRQRDAAGIAKSIMADASPENVEAAAAALLEIHAGRASSVFLEPVQAAPRILDLYENGFPKAVSCGWPSWDRVEGEDGAFLIGRGELTIVTGIPGHGKGEVVDNLIVNTIKQQGWKWLVYSPENAPYEVHVRKLLEKYAAAPFAEGFRPRIPREEIKPLLDKLNTHIRFIHPEQTELLTHILRARDFNAIVLDPWNHIDERRQTDRSETDYVQRVLLMLRRFARNTGQHIFLVVHPSKLHRDRDGKYPRPTPYDLHGSAHFRNIADNILMVWRDFKDDKAPVEIDVQKIRFKWHGQCGTLLMAYDRATGVYYEYDGTRTAPQRRGPKADD